MMRNSKGNWVENKEDLNSLIVEYYQNLFKKELGNNLDYDMSPDFQV